MTKNKRHEPCPAVDLQIRRHNATAWAAAACLGTRLKAKEHRIAVREEICTSYEAVIDAKTAAACTSLEAACTSREAEFITTGAWIAKMCTKNEETTALGKAELAERCAKHGSEVEEF